MIFKIRSFLILFCMLVPLIGFSAVRIKDIVHFEGVRDNMLVGYGLVVGLKGTGDSESGSPFAEKSLRAMLERLGVNTDVGSIKTKNVAAVMVTATLPPFTMQGARLDVNVSSLGDAKSLLGGMLLVTPLLAADGQVYAVSQGTLAIAGFEASGKGETVTRGVPTAGRIAAGAIVEREIKFQLEDLKTMRLSLRNPDLTTADRIASAINRRMRKNIASVVDQATVALDLMTLQAGEKKSQIIAFLTAIEQLRIIPDQQARVIIDERSGVIVMGEKVRISKVAVAQGNLTIRITERPQASQPNPFANVGDTVKLERTTIDVNTDEERQLGIINSGISLQELVHSLNALGVGPRDMITILQAIKAAGALQASIEVI